MATFADAITTARDVYLNDNAGRILSDDRMFSVAKEAYRELKRGLGINNDQVFREIQAISYTAGDVVLSNFTAMLYPVKLEERPASSTSVADYTPILEQEWELGADKEISENLKFWSFRENEIKVLPATTDRTVRGYFDKSLADPAAAGDTIAISRGEEYIAPKIAAMVSAFTGSNFDRASACNDIAERVLQDMKIISVKNKQSLPAKRLPYRGRKRLPFLV